MSVRHYSLRWSAPTPEYMDVAACGLSGNFYARIPNDPDYPVTCKGCIASQAYKQDLITIEIVFDGNWEAWVRERGTCIVMPFF